MHRCLRRPSRQFLFYPVLVGLGSGTILFCCVSWSELQNCRSHFSRLRSGEERDVPRMMEIVTLRDPPQVFDKCELFSASHCLSSDGGRPAGSALH